MLAERLEVYLEALKLKALSRSGWVRAGVPQPESVAAHSWGVAWLGLNFCPPQLDRQRVLELALLHDLAECRVGDLTPYDPVTPAAKERAEAEALGRLAAPLAKGNEWRERLEEYQAAQTAEARLVQALDKLDMALQALAYARTYPHLELGEFIESARRRLEALKKFPAGREIEELMVLLSRHLEALGSEVP